MGDDDFVIGLRWIAGAVRKGASPPGVPSLMETAADEIARLRADLAAAGDVIKLILPLAKGYAPEGQTPQARRTCDSWIASAGAFIDRGA